MKPFISARIAGLVALVVSFLVVPTAAWSKDPVNTTLFGNKAIHGYDPVAYFVDGKPLPGKAEFEFVRQGAKWRFVTAEHRDAFKKAQCLCGRRVRAFANTGQHRIMGAY